ncbi:MAG TPA: hypothetical protein PKW80_01090 [Bacteroidales bacterium]|nr:hypothetical protein [Bacteroidales bacterium]
MISINIACSHHKSENIDAHCNGQTATERSSINKDSAIDKILLVGFSDDSIQKNKEISMLLEYMEKKELDLKYRKTMLISLESMEVCMNSSQKLRFVKLRDSKTTNVCYVNQSGGEFDTVTFNKNLKLYLRSNHYKVYDDLSTEQLAAKCNEIFTDKVNARYASGVPANQVLTADDLNYLAGSSGFLEYCYEKIISINDSTKKLAWVKSLSIINEMINAVPVVLWNDKKVKVKRASQYYLNSKYNELIENYK